MSVIHCPHCGTTNRAGSNFCNRCGANLRSEEPQEEANTQPGATAGETGAAPADLDPTATSFADDREPHAFADHSDETASRLPPAELPEDTDWAATAEVTELSSRFTTTRRLVTGIQGLLDPVQIASELSEDMGTTASLPSVAPPFAIQAEQLRRIRTLLTDDPVLLDAPVVSGQPTPIRLYLPWLILLLTLAIALPILLDLLGPVGAPQPWPGVAEAYAVIDALPADATALVLWEYDAATAAELDLVALPLVSHLLARRIQPILVSQLPGGPAVADRLFTRAVAGLRADTAFRFIIDRELYVNAGYLPGGAALLSFVAQDPGLALVRHSPLAPIASPLANAAVAAPALTIVVAAQAEAVQQWLEQGQPLQGQPTVAFTSAGADPMLRPYLASGQLSGLVSGFDGAFTYQKLRTVHLAVAEEALLARQVVLQNWGHFALLCLLLLGNLATWGRGGHRG